MSGQRKRRGRNKSSGKKRRRKRTKIFHHHNGTVCHETSLKLGRKKKTAKAEGKERKGIED